MFIASFIGFVIGVVAGMFVEKLFGASIRKHVSSEIAALESRLHISKLP